MKRFTSNLLPWVLLAAILLGSGIFVGIRYYQSRRSQSQIVTKDANAYIAFSDEVYDTIIQNYWKKISDADLTEIYRLVADKINTSTPANLPSGNKEGLNILVENETKNLSAEQKKIFVTALADGVLSNLAPIGRSRLYTQAQTQNLNNEVNNIDTSTNLYASLGVGKDASQQEINKTYQEKSQELAKQNTPQAKQELAQINRAHEALKTPERKQTYDQTGAEPAVTFRAIDKNIYYIKISRFSPTLLQELKEAASSTPAGASSLILDLRGNIGGAIDQLPAVLSDFLGTNASAFSFFHQGTYTPYPSLSSALPQMAQFKKTIILTDNQVQSSAEVMTGALKKYNFGVVVGLPTRGWGSVERVFDLQNQIDFNQKYSVFLVHTLTLADDNQPIEGRGILPDIDISNKDWQKILTAATNLPDLAAAVKNIFNQ